MSHKTRNAPYGPTVRLQPYHQSTASGGTDPKHVAVAHSLAITQTLTACLSPTQIHRAPLAPQRSAGRLRDRPTDRPTHCPRLSHRLCLGYFIGSLCLLQYSAVFNRSKQAMRLMQLAQEWAYSRATNDMRKNRELVTITNLDIIHCPAYYLKTTFRRPILYPSSDGTYSVGPNRLG
jgi:hypothetical protein